MELTSILDGLNEAQQQAATTIDGPLMVIAGPGTGKTLTIVRRIAYLIHQGVPPGQILAVTFTNRAAREMRERIDALLGGRAGNVFIGTFHLLGLKILRERVSGDFVVYNREEQLDLLKKTLGCSLREARQRAEQISRRKNFMEAGDDEVQRAYEIYQAALEQDAAFDFDDLILKPMEMLGEEDTLAKYRERFRHIIVDEYQDINPAQYRLVRLLAEESSAVCAVGDADQAIYAFRGADIESFLHFERDFSGARRIALTKSYRSTGVILNAANSMIKNNQHRIDRALAPVREQGTRIRFISVPDERAEADAVIGEIEARMGATSRYRMYTGAGGEVPERSYRFSDFAIVFRTNAQARALEDALIPSGIPYQIIGRQNSMQKKDVAETIAWLHTLAQVADDDVAPGRGYGQEAKLLGPADFFDPRADAVTLMTLHMAKGLEFPVVFVAGVDDGLIPSTMMKEDCDHEEERRLFYVGMTRAKDDLFLLHGRTRFLYGQRLHPSPSPFIGEISGNDLDTTVVPERVKKQKKEEEQLGLF